MELYNRLEDTNGQTNWWPADTPFEVCIGAILTQNAPWRGVVKSINNLKENRIFDVHIIADTPEQILAKAIRPSIYYNQKAKKLKTFCRFLLERYKGKIENMAGQDMLEARKTLLALPGIGCETADSILLYALGMPVFVVDAYTRRIFTRHGLIDPNWDYENIRNFFEEALEPDVGLYGEFHALICLLGANYCKRNPGCDNCPAKEIMGEPVL
ncbi:MAG: endonuclease III domain-containing protein [Candidatus Latescibacteria bacterium]|nr:endonuclease III domain-containing protein [Candidatus Latescibacterota bacterium]